MKHPPTHSMPTPLLLQVSEHQLQGGGPVIGNVQGGGHSYDPPQLEDEGAEAQKILCAHV